MPLKLYYIMPSPPARSVILTLKTLNIPYEPHVVNLLKGEQLTEKYLKINPQHTVPTIVDEDGFAIWDSHAINSYLVNKYADYDHMIYPKEPVARAVVDQRLHFDSSVLFTALRNAVGPIAFKKTVNHMTDELKAPILAAYEFVEKFLEKTRYIAGEEITIADFSFCTTLANLEVLVPINKLNFPLIVEYLVRCEENIASLKEVNAEGLEIFKNILKNAGFQFPQPE